MKQKKPVSEKDFSGKRSLWEQTVDAIPYPVSLIGPNYQVLRINKAMRRFLGLSSGATVNGNCRNIMHEICRPDNCPVKTVLRDRKRTKVVMEKSGRFYEISVTPVFSGKKIEGMLHTVVDITRAEKESRLSDRNKAMAEVLRQITLALISKIEYPLLCETICKAIVESGLVKFAWIGIADREKKTVNPTACYGESSWYIDNLQVRYDNSKYGKGPTGTAVRTNTPVVNHDFASGKKLIPWKAKAKKA